MLADYRRRQIDGLKTYFVKNYHIDYSNVCVLDCKFCAFKRNIVDSDAYTLSADEIIQKIKAEFEKRGLREVHLVGGLNPDLPYEYYLQYN